MTEFGTIRMLYTMQPCGADGRPINGGNHYANANTIESARDYARDVLARKEYLGYTIDSVDIWGVTSRLTHAGWTRHPGPTEHEVIRRENTESAS